MMVEMNDSVVRYPLEIYRGDAFVRTFTAIYKTTYGTSQTVSFANWTGRCQIRDEIDGAVLWEGTTENGRLITGPQTNGQGSSWQLLLYLSPIDTASLPAGFIGRYDIELTRPDGYRRTWYADKICVEGDVTHG